MKSINIITMLLIAVAVFVLIAGCTTNSPVTPTAMATAAPTTTIATTATIIPVTTTLPTVTMTAKPATTAKITTIPTNATQGTVTIEMTAKGFAFNTSLISVPAGVAVTIRFNNQDSGVSHNIAIYDSPAQQTNIFRGELITGVKTIEYQFTAPSTRGDYYFRCDPHAVMNGIFRVT
jgi:plastocyanin